MLLATLFLLGTIGPSSANVITSSQPLAKSVEKATLIIKAHLIKFVPDQAAPLPTTTDGYIDDKQPATDIYAMNPAGLYTFTEVQCLKGKYTSRMVLRLPAMLRVYYAYAQVNIHEGKDFLLMLTKTASGHYEPVDPTIPLIPVEPTEIISKGDPIHLVLATMLTSLDDPAIRKANTFLVRETVDASLPGYVSPLIKNSDLTVVDNVLYCLVTNNHIEVIPLVEQLENKLYPTEETIGSSATALTAVAHVTNPDAVKFINPLLDSPSQYARVDAMLAIRRIGDKSSIPYLIRVFDKPDPQDFLWYSAYVKIHRLVPVLGYPKSEAYFDRHRESESKAIKDWYVLHHNDHLTALPKP